VTKLPSSCGRAPGAWTITATMLFRPVGISSRGSLVSCVRAVVDVTSTTGHRLSERSDLQRHIRSRLKTDRETQLLLSHRLETFGCPRTAASCCAQLKTGSSISIRKRARMLRREDVARVLFTAHSCRSRSDRPVASGLHRPYLRQGRNQIVRLTGLRKYARFTKNNCGRAVLVFRAWARE
jgi:hypothetical protein